MSLERIHLLVEQFADRVRTTPVASVTPWSLDPILGRDLLESMLLARHVDCAAHDLRASGHGHYTICSSGHEGNVVLGRLTTPHDPTLVHYRSAALYIERGRHDSSVDAVRDICLALVASSEEPLCSGRHKVFGNRKLGIMPQTSTIASHLPRALGMAFALERRQRLGLPVQAAPDAVSVVSFGDASLNHSTALGTFNAAGWVAHQKLTLPLLFVCEDNGLGVSVRTPAGWTEARLQALPQVRYFKADGLCLQDAYTQTRLALDYCRQSRRPAVLHMTCMRLLGHAGSDVDTTYRTQEEISVALDHDPLVRAALSLLAGGALDLAAILELDAQTKQRVAVARDYAKTTARLDDRTTIAASVARPIPRLSSQASSELENTSEQPRTLTLAQGINQALRDALERFPESLLFGEDVAKKGGVYGITKGLLAHAGPARVFNTLLDEQTILGLALGCSSLGLLPIPEIQYLAYLHNAEDQLRGEAATLPFFSNGAYDNPMVVRIAGLAYQKGFGGHFHNDNSIAVLRDIPGIIVMVPARGDDALELYRRAFELATEQRRVVVVVEPIALYHQKDLVSGQDGRWLAAAVTTAASFGETRVYHPEAGDLLVVTYANGLYLSLRARETLRKKYGIQVRVLDLRWLVPLPIDDVFNHAQELGRVLIVDECRTSAGVHEALAASLYEQAQLSEMPAGLRVARVTSADCFIPLGDAANSVLVSEAEIVAAALQLLGNPSPVN